MSRRVYLVEHVVGGRRTQSAYLYERGAYQQVGRLLQGQQWSRVESSALVHYVSADEREVLTLTALEARDA